MFFIFLFLSLPSLKKWHTFLFSLKYEVQSFNVKQFTLHFAGQIIHFIMKGLKIIVLAKQVPDTRNVGKDAMKADGTVNRAALPAIFNPEDLNALEQALELKVHFQEQQSHF